jgi:DNA replicative helicase MCM subunit Mcm2 (Cdc46/Mcm family)
LIKGEEKRRCKAYESMPGTGCCRNHGGMAPATAYRNLRRQTLAKVGSEVNKVVEGTVIFPDNPFDSLNQVLIEVRQFKELIENQIERMNEEQEPWRFQDKAGGEQLRSEIQLYERALDRMIRAASALAKLNLEERFVKLSEQQAASMVYIINEVFKRSGLDDNQREMARDMVTVVIKEMLTQTGKKRYI